MRSIKRSQKFEEIVKKLAIESHPITRKPVFPTIRELVCFAAVLGFENNWRRHLQEETDEVDGRIFSNSQQALDLIYLIALAAEKDGDILRVENEDKMIQIFEEFAEGGFEFIQQWLQEKPGDLYGNEALLDAFTKYNFLEIEVDTEQAIADISFA
jgi:dnd system-associated protein 4